MPESLCKPFTTAVLIPTGVGAAQGGFAGDAGVYLKLIASISDAVITHPNVCNAAAFISLPPNVLYTEGAMLDAWLRQKIALRPVRTQTIGVIFDAAMPEPERVLHRNVIAACQNVYGLDILAPVITREPLALACTPLNSQTASGGSLNNPNVLIEAAQTCQAMGASAIAICSWLDPMIQAAGDAEHAYQAGTGVDPIGGLEAILSHSVTQTLNLPCANAPVLSLQTAQPETEKHLPGKVAAEFITPTFLPCVLQGLAQAPQPVLITKAHAQDLRAEALDALITPYNCLGGPGLLSVLQHGKTRVIAVHSNSTVLNVTSEALNAFMPQAQAALSQVIHVQNYYEAVGVLQSLKMGFKTPLEQAQ
ncbi:MAG: DUF3326 domain-containing protein [Vampirovibrionales bacterium]|nr:DUF3326 domain-containing protein [Vampirovibrionales bacterium]